MLISNQKPGAFITLLANESNDEINAQLSAYFGDFVNITDSLADTAAALQGEKYKLLILDIKLTGLNYIQQIKAADSHYSETPVIALTDEMNLSQRKELISSGFDDYLSKPLTIAKVDEAINLWINQNSLDATLTAAHNLLSKCRYNRKLAATLYTKIFEQFPQRLEDLDHSLKSKDYQTAHNICHALDSEARVCFLNDISAVAKNLEETLKLKKHEAVTADYIILKNIITDFTGQQERLLNFFNEISTP